MVHRYRYGYGRFYLISTMRPRTKNAPRAVAFTTQLLCCLRGFVFCRHRDVQGLHGIQEFQASWTLDHLHPLALGLRSHLRRLTTDPGVPYVGRSMAHR